MKHFYKFKQIPLKKYAGLLIEFALIYHSTFVQLSENAPHT